MTALLGGAGVRFQVSATVGRLRPQSTRDFAIDIEPYVPLRSRLELLKSCGGHNIKNVKIKTLLLEKTLTSLELEEVDFGIESSYEEVYQHFQERYEFCRRQVEIYEAQKQHRSRPNPNILKFASTSPKSTKIACKGFAAS